VFPSYRPVSLCLCVCYSDFLCDSPFQISHVQVDAHNIVPCWKASDKQEYSARTIRGKINSKLSTYLVEFPPIVEHLHTNSDSALQVCNNVSSICIIMSINILCYSISVLSSSLWIGMRLGRV